MKKINIKIGETTIDSNVSSEVHMTNGAGFDMSKISPGFAMPIPEIIGEVSSVTAEGGSVSFTLGEYEFSIGQDCPEWLRPGVRVKVGLYDKTILLLDENEQ